MATSFNLGDKVKFIDSNKRFKKNKFSHGFRGLYIPDQVFRLSGIVVGYLPRCSFLPILGLDKTIPLVEFDMTAPKPNFFSFEIPDKRKKVLAIPQSFLKHFELESNHPLTNIFV